ncbi:MAG: hypothetical protein WC238_03540 [Parcubacteria group bacterium]
MKMRLLGMLFLFVLVGLASEFADPTEAVIATTHAEWGCSVVAEQSGDTPRLLLVDRGAWGGSRIAVTDAEVTGSSVRTLNLPSTMKGGVASAGVSGAGLGGATYMACTKATGLTVGSSAKTAAKTADGMTKKMAFA